jgi:hypothetical protein
MARPSVSPDAPKQRPSDTWKRWHTRSARIMIECGEWRIASRYHRLGR